MQKGMQIMGDRYPHMSAASEPMCDNHLVVSEKSKYVPHRVLYIPEGRVQYFFKRAEDLFITAISLIKKTVNICEHIIDYFKPFFVLFLSME
jgi:hypothetical protein